MKKILALLGLAILSTSALAGAPVQIICNTATNAPCPAASTGSNGTSANTGFGITNQNINYLKLFWALPANAIIGSDASGNLEAIMAGANITIANGQISSTGGGGGTGAWSTLTPGTNTLGAYLVGTGSSFGPTAGGTVTANQWTGSALSVASGGNGTGTPSLNAGANIVLTGSWPNYTIAASSSISTSWGSLTPGTLPAGSYLCGTGCSIGVSGSGNINATTWAGAASPTSAPFIYTDSGSQPHGGTCGNGIGCATGVIAEAYQKRNVTGTSDTLLASDSAYGVKYSCSAACAVSTPQATGTFAAVSIDVANNSLYPVTFTTSTSVFNIGNQTSSTYILYPGREVSLTANGGNWDTDGTGNRGANATNSITASSGTLTPVCTDNDEINVGTRSDASGTLTIAAPTGCPAIEGWKVVIDINTTNVMTYSWNSAYVGSNTALPTTSSGAGKEDIFAFFYSSIKGKYVYIPGVGGI